ncbi:hypothetical protein ACGLWX_01360 [Halomonas sp. HMF6819]|uniref:hypothetical protein n=1 Tax=unclassified Halomonas TaxID=2609666 RepID=UPI0020767999|nr:MULTISPECIES: hypothetical protein [unclassified Halomonas]
MKHLEKCEQCGKEYDPSEPKGAPEDPENCDSCGADIKPKGRRSSFLVDDSNEEDGGQHMLEKTLREASHKADTDD